MRRICFICVTLMFAALATHAGDNNNVFSHYSLSVGIGTTGVTGDLGTMVTDYLGLRGGVDYTSPVMPCWIFTQPRALVSASLWVHTLARRAII